MLGCRCYVWMNVPRSTHVHSAFCLQIYRPIYQNLLIADRGEHADKRCICGRSCWLLLAFDCEFILVWSLILIHGCLRPSIVCNYA